MALLPSARVAVRLALANYLRTNMSAAWPNLVVTENWPNPQKAFPPQAITVLAPVAGQLIEYHQPVIWKVLNPTGAQATVLYSYGKMEIPLELDVWAQFESVRDDLASTLLPLLNQNPEITLGTATLSNLQNAPGLVLVIPAYSSVTAEYRFDPTPTAVERDEAAVVSDWRYVWNGTATIYLMQSETQPLMKNVSIQMAANGAAPELFPFDYQGQVLADAPILYWRLGEAAAATTVTDIAGGSHTGTVTSPANVTFGSTGLLAAGSAPNDINTAALATSTLPSIKTTDNLGTLSAFTVEWWIKPTALTAGGNDIGQAFNIFYCQQNANGSIKVGTTSGAAITTAINTYIVGQTSHCAFVYDGVNGSFYLNGQLVNGPSAMPAPSGPLNAFGFGVTGPWQSTVQEIAVYATALSRARVLNHFYLGSIGP